MNLALSEHLPLIASAPDGIQKLRGLILELAVRGKLVAQDPKDEPASELLKRIRQERSRLDGAKSRKKIEPPLHASASPLFELPRSWTWVPFGEIALHNSGKTLDKGRNAGQPRDYITTSNLYWGRFELDDLKRMLIGDDELDRCTARKNDLLICEGGEAGRAAVWPYDREVCFQNHVHRARFIGDIAPQFGFRFFEWLNASGEIEHYRKGVGISNMSGKALASIPFTLPPLAEQHRIVAKVDELMALCDRLESEQYDSAAAHEQLVETLLGTLTQSTDAADFEANWKRIAEHFDTLFTTEASIELLQKIILQLAIMGKLVPQDPNDEPAPKIFASEKIFESALPYEIPYGWTLTNLNNVAEINGGFAFKSTDYTDDGMRVVRISDFDELGFKDHKIVRHSFRQELSKFCLAEDNILMAMTGGTVGKSLLVNVLPEPMIVNQRVATIKVLEGTCATYVDIVIRAEGVQAAIQKAKNSTNDNISMNDIKGFAVPLPPLEEQFRIVAKVDELMAFCDQLKASIKAATAAQSTLSAALIQQALEAA